MRIGFRGYGGVTNVGGGCYTRAGQAPGVAAMAQRTDRAWCIEVPRKVIEVSQKQIYQTSLSAPSYP